MIRIDHIGFEARDAETAARALAEILGAPPPVTDGADDDMFRVDLDDGASLLFATSATPRVEHIAFRVGTDQFAAVLARLSARGVAFGNDPDAPTKGKTSDPLGGDGRVYFTDDSGHLFEVTC